jgi:hypothetical protein
MLRSILFQAALPVHYDVLPCRGWDLAEEEVDFSRRPLLVVVSFVVVAAVAVVAVAAIAVLWGGIAWFTCGDDVLLVVWGWGGGGEGEGGGGVEGSRAADWVEASVAHTAANGGPTPRKGTPHRPRRSASHVGARVLL